MDDDAILIPSATRRPSTVVAAPPPVMVEDGTQQCIIAIAGEVDLATAAWIAASGVGAAEATGAPEVVIDVSAVTFMDVSGLRSLLEIRNAADARDRRVRLHGVSRRVTRLLDLTGLHAEFGRTNA